MDNVILVNIESSVGNNHQIVIIIYLKETRTDIHIKRSDTIMNYF